MNTALTRRLTPTLFRRMVDAALDRYQLVVSESDSKAHFTKRLRYERIAAGEHWYRLQAEGYDRIPGGQPQATVFDKINESLNIIPSVRDFLVSRICKDLFGSTPWMYVRPQGVTTKNLALKLQQHAEYKLDQAEYVRRMKEAVGIALDLGESPVKTTWVKKADCSERLATLLVYSPGNAEQAGQPVLTGDGDNIEQSEEMTGGDEQVDAEGMPTGEMNPMTFKDHPEITYDPAAMEWQERFVYEETTLYEGLDIRPVKWNDVHWPINAASLEDADFVSHTFDMRLSAMRAKYAPNSYRAQIAETQEDLGDNQGDPELEMSYETEQPSEDESVVDPMEADVVAILDKLKSESLTPKSKESQPNNQESQVTGTEDDDPVIKVVECSYDFACFDDGIVRRLLLVLLPESQDCIFCDFRANVCPRASKPIHLIVVNKVKHRAYGRGLHEIYEKLANLADRLLCGILWRNAMISNPAKIWNPLRTKQGKAEPNLILGPDVTIEIEGTTWGPKDVLEYIEMPDLDERTWQLMELIMQLIQVRSGVTNANQGDMTDLPSNTTATGVNSMLESSSVLHQYVLEEVRDCMTPQLAYAIELIYMMQNRNETFDYLEQDVDPNSPNAAEDQQTIESIMELGDAKRLGKLPMMVEFLLTRAKRQEQREAAMAGIPLGIQYGTLPAPDKVRMRDVFIQLFRSLGFDDADKPFPLPDPNAPPPGPPPPKASENVAIKFELLPQNQKDAIMAEMGIPAAVGPMPVAPTGQAGAQPSSSPQSMPPAAPLPSNVNDDSGDAARLPEPAQ